MVPFEIESDGIAAYVKPVENFLDRIHRRSLRGKTYFSRVSKALSWPRLIVYAALRVLGNPGAYTAGIDAIHKGIFMRTFGYQVNCIRQLVKDYDPLAILRVYIPKKNGEKRPLGIPALRDRVIQEMIRLILEAIYEPVFSPYSFGFRPGFSIHDALNSTYCYLQPAKKMQYVIEFDIRKFFDNVDHGVLLSILTERVRDNKLLRMIKTMLRSMIYESGKLFPCRLGVPQGGVVSPLLANIYLNEFDVFMDYLRRLYAKCVPVKRGQHMVEEWRRRKDGGVLGFVRYADDCVAFWNGSKRLAREIIEDCKNFLKKRLPLELNMEKTLLTDVEEGFKFVGFFFVRKRTSKSRRSSNSAVKLPVVDVPKDTVSETKRGITATLREATISGWDLRYTILRVNQKLDGFYNCFKMTTYARARMEQIFSHASQQFYFYLRRSGYKQRDMRRLFYKRVNGRLTWSHQKYALRVPPSSVELELTKWCPSRLGINSRYSIRLAPLD